MGISITYHILTKSKIILMGAVLFFSLKVSAQIKRIEVIKQELYKDGKQYGDIGTYQKITGRAYGELDPDNPLNKRIQDISLAPRNENGKVAYACDFIILCPTVDSKSNGLLFLSLPNRGNPFPSDEVLLNRGYVYLWCGWQGDVLPGNGRLAIRVPVATDHGKVITGWLRTEYGTTKNIKTLNLSSGPFEGFIHHSYETVSLDNRGLTLTKRVHETDSHIKVPNDNWAFADCKNNPFPGDPSTTQISVKGGFDPNYIYELTYKAKNPLVLGIGFAAIRDMASYLKYDEPHARERLAKSVDSVQTKSLVRSLNIKKAVMQGISQCSNFTRTFLALGFNQDLQGRKVFDGINAHIGPRRISLNVRFGRPGGGGMQREDHLFPGNEPPFTWDNRTDSVSGVKGGILRRCNETNTCPLIMQTFTSSEYWQSRAALTHTAPKGNYDLPIPENVRIYLINGTEHGPRTGKNNMTGFRYNDNLVEPTHRALLVALDGWVLNGVKPPDSQYPTIAAGNLVKPDKKSMGWRNIPGVPFNGKVNNPPLLDFGLTFNESEITGIIQEPVKIISGKSYAVLVPKVDGDDNEVGGIRNVDLRVPIATYTGWSIRKQGFGAGDLASLDGMAIPFTVTRKARIAAGDPRLSLEERYGDHAGYVAAVRKACKQLVHMRFLLQDDVEQIIARAKASEVLKRQ